MAIRECHVSFVDQRGIRHSVAVYAGSVLEAAAAGLKQIRETEMIGDDGVQDLTVDIKTTTSHKVPLFKLKFWLQSSGPRSTRSGIEIQTEITSRGEFR